MKAEDEEEKLLHNVALKNAKSILHVRQSADEELRQAKGALETKTEQLAYSLSLMRATFESTTDGILVTNEKRETTDFNRKFLEMWRLPPPVIETGGHAEILAITAKSFQRPEEELQRIELIYRTSPAETYDLLELADGRVFERFSKIQLLDGRDIGRVWSFRDITERLIAEQDLRESQDRFRAAFNQAAVGIAIADLDGRFLELNQKFAEILGYSPQELQQLTTVAITHPDDLVETAALVEDLLAERIANYTLEKRYIRKDGSFVWSLTNVALLRDSTGRPTRFIGVIEDISQRKRAEEALLDETRTLELLNRTGASLASTLDLQKLVQAVTDAGTEIIGAEIGAFFYNVINPQGESFLLFTLSGAEREAFEKFGMPRNTPVFDPTFRGQGVIRSEDITKDPRYGQVEPHRGMPKGHFPVRSYLAVPVMGRSGEVLGGLFFGHSSAGKFSERDERIMVSIASQSAVAIDNARLYDESKQAAEERKHLLESERHARTQAERTSGLKDEFLATLSHELRTPLNAILGWSQLLRRGKRDEASIAQGLDVIERNARMQAQLIEDLLDMSRIISGKIRLEIQPVQPLTFIEASIETIRPAADAKGIRVEKILDLAAGPIYGDPNRLQQVIWNLLSNAVKFTPKDGKIQVVLERVNSHIEISVADTGIGIKPEFVQHVFERFRQADASSTRQHGGLGLGLSIVKHLVELHGGSIEVSSAGENLGATFCVHLPLTAVHRNEHDSDRLHPKTPKHGAFTFNRTELGGVKVLVVDDEPDARVLIERLLSECGAEVFTASSADEALKLVESVKPNVLLSDIGMPDVDGYELLRRVRALGPANGGAVPAIALTAFARSEDRTRALRAGFSVHVSKPVEPAELVASVASVSGRAAGFDVE